MDLYDKIKQEKKRSEMSEKRDEQQMFIVS